MSEKKKKIIGVTVGTPISSTKIGNDLKPEIKVCVEEQLGDMDTAVDTILEIQKALMGGEK